MKNPSHLFLWARLAEIVRDGSAGLPVTVDEPGDLRIETESGQTLRQRQDTAPPRWGLPAAAVLLPLHTTIQS